MTAAGTAGTVSVLHCRAANAAAATSWSQQIVCLKRVETAADLCCRSSAYCHRHDMAACCVCDNIVAITAACCVCDNIVVITAASGYQARQLKCLQAVTPECTL